MKKFLIILFWIVSIVATSFYTYEHPEKIEQIKYYLNKNKKPLIDLEKNDNQKVKANFFTVEFSKVISLSEKTTFIFHENNTDFNENSLNIYTQNGYLINNMNAKRLNLPKSFTMQRNGGVKTIFIHKENTFALISSSKKECYFAAIVNLNTSKEIFKTNCLVDTKKNTDFNGLGSSTVNIKDKILISIGAPEQGSSKIRKLAQKKTSSFGKIMEIKKNDLNKIISNEESNITLNLFSMGHRNPQGLTKIGDVLFSVEHGPLGGDELNRIEKNKNYGWPLVSYGTKYLYEKSGKSYKLSHEEDGFEEPLFALVPSVGISGLNVCPNILNDFYKKPCLMALSLHGNNLRPGKSILIYLLNKDLNKVHSVEQIYLKDDLFFRHFVTNKKNILYEDQNGDIYVSADKKGIYRLSFKNFRK
jgi:glucose/arabinose dehydrogenase